MEDMLKPPIVQLLAMWIYAGGDLLMDEPKLRDFLDNLIEVLDMTIIMPTIGLRLPIKHYVDAHGKKPKESDCGYSFVTMIAESHCCLHTWPMFKKAFLEIVSCKEFDTSSIIETIEKYFPDCRIESKRLDM